MLKLRKIIAFVLVICVATLFNGIAFAAAPEIPKSDQMIDDKAELPHFVEGNDVYSQKDYNIDTKYDGIKKSADGFFAMIIETDEGLREIPVGKIDINLASKKDVNVALSNDNIAPEIKERIALRHKQVTESGYKMANVTLFSSELLPKNNVVSSGYSTQATSSSTYYTYNGAQMRSDKLFYDDLDTGYQYIKRGSSTKTITNGIVDIVMIVASTANVYVGFLASGISLLQAFNNMFGTTWATGSTEDFCQVKLIYDNTDQWTYRKIGNDWYLGLCSQKAVISNISSV
ncbi:MAG: hypothetical protein GX815_04660 [Clostridiales bacterium]|nr:hypothetical protein [Clostridiales bacterium]